MRGLLRSLVTLLVVAAVVIGLFIADEWSRDQAERRITEMVAASVEGGSVTTEVGGWPFLVARLANRMDEVSVTLTDATFTMGEIRGVVDRVDVIARGVSPIDDPTQAVAGSLDANITLGWDRLGALLGFPVERIGPDRIAVRTSLTVLGVSAEILVEANVAIQPDGTLQLSEPSATAAGVRLPDEVVQSALDRLVPQLRLPSVPGLEYAGLTLGTDVVTVQLSGQDVPLAALA